MLDFRSNSPSSCRVNRRRCPFPRGAPRADSYSWSGRQRKVRGPQATTDRRPCGSSERAGLGRPGVFTVPAGQPEAVGGGGGLAGRPLGPRAASAGAEGVGGGAEGAGSASWEIHQHGAKSPPPPP